ncbi:MAG: hypothetical protein RI531_09545 [Haloferacaceae archaeon]|nr:hypothetical protein [Haloferacaceae archaeon]
MSREQPPHDAVDVQWVSGELCSVGCIPVAHEKVYRLRIDTSGGPERVYLSPQMRGLRLDLATGDPVNIGPILECDLQAMEVPIGGVCDRCGGTLRRWCVVDRFPQIRAVIDPDAEVAIAVRQARLSSTHADAALSRQRQEVQICTACGREHPVDQLRQMV